MSDLLTDFPFSLRQDDRFLADMIAITRHHLGGCPEYASIWRTWRTAAAIEELPFLHVGIFKHILFKTEVAGITHQRILKSSATTSGRPSRIVLDEISSVLQTLSSVAVLKDMVGDRLRPLLILDSARSLRRRNEVAARVAAAMSLRPLATEFHFLLENPDDPHSMKWETLLTVLRRHDDVLVYGFTWMLWQAWGVAAVPTEVKAALRNKRVHFVHSGGWKKLESQKVDRTQFDTMLLKELDQSSRVVDFYGLVEQAGVIYPLCDQGFRHVPRWAEVIVRDPYSLAPLTDEPGLLQLLNVLAHGAPYHSVLTEDLGQLVPGDCACGRLGRRFRLLGRVPRAEARGCANV